MAQPATSGRLAFRLEISLKFLYFICHIQHSLEKIYLLVFYIDLLVRPHGPESFFQIVVLRSAESVDIAVCTMVVGYQKALVRDHASCTAECHRNDCIRHRGTRRIRIVYLSGRKLKSSLDHLLLQRSIDGIDHPHTLIRLCYNAASNPQKRANCYSNYKFKFHSRNNLLKDLLHLNHSLKAISLNVSFSHCRPVSKTVAAHGLVSGRGPRQRRGRDLVFGTGWQWIIDYKDKPFQES